VKELVLCHSSRQPPKAMTIDAASGVVEWFVDLILAIYPIASQADFSPPSQANPEYPVSPA